MLSRLTIKSSRYTNDVRLDLLAQTNSDQSMSEFNSLLDDQNQNNLMQQFIAAICGLINMEKLLDHSNKRTSQ